MCLIRPFSCFHSLAIFPIYMKEAAAIDRILPCVLSGKSCFPMAQSGIVTVTIFALLISGTSISVTDLHSSDKLKPVAPGLYGMINSMKYTGDWAGMFAAVIIVFLPNIYFCIFSCLKIIGGVTGGIKDNIRGQQDNNNCLRCYCSHYPARCFGMNMPKSRHTTKIPLRRQSGIILATLL